MSQQNDINLILQKLENGDLEAGNLHLREIGFRCRTLTCDGCEFKSTDHSPTRCPAVPTEYWDNMYKDVKALSPEYFI